MNKKLNRMQFILIIASLFIMFANISLFTNDLVENNIIKAIIGMLIPSLLLVIAYEVEKVLKLEKSSKLITLMSMVSFFITIVGTYFNLIENNVTNEGFLIIKSFNLNIYTVVALTGVIVPIIGYFLNKDEIYKKILVISSLYLWYFLLNSIYSSLIFKFGGMTNSNGILEFVTLSLIVLLYNLFLSNKYSKTLSITNFFYTIYVLDNINMNMDTIIPSIAISSICIIAFLLRIRKEESKRYDTVPFIGIVLFLVSLISAYMDELIILPLGFVIVTDMLIIVADVVKDRKEGLIYKIILDLLTMFILLVSIGNGYYIIPMILVVLVTSLISTYALKSDYHEQYILPFKTILCIFGLLVEINNYVKLDYVLIVLAINIFAALCSYFQTNKTFKELFSIIAMSTYVFMFSISAPFEFIVLLSMIIFDYIVQFEVEKRSTSYKNIFVVLSIIMILSSVRVFDNALLYLLSALVFILGHIIIKEKGLSIISYIAFTIASMIFVSQSGMNYEVSDVLSMLLLFGGGFYLTNKINSLNIPLFKIILIWGLVVSLFCLDTLVSTLVGLVISIIVLLVYVKDMSGMFKSGVILTVIGIIRLLNELNEVPTFVYLLILGITVVFIIFKSMKKYISEPESLEDEKVKFKKSGKLYCTNCGKEITKDSKFCPYCGHKINK